MAIRFSVPTALRLSRRCGTCQISERFFAGGNTTVRGFQLDRLGSEDVFVQNVPIGGNGLLVFNAELRRLVAQLFGRDFGVVAFVDSGNVFPDASDVDLARNQRRRRLRRAVGLASRASSTRLWIQDDPRGHFRRAGKRMGIPPQYW